MPFVRVFDVLLCPCCIVYLANDDKSGCDYEHNHLDPPEPLLSAIGRVVEPGDELVPGSADSDVKRRFRCDGCTGEFFDYAAVGTVIRTVARPTGGRA